VNLSDFNVLAGRFGATVAPAGVGDRHGSGTPPDASEDREDGRDALPDELVGLLG
jgi:hypothetical protein